MKRIQEVAKEFNVTPRTLRYYEEIGLLNPNRTPSKLRTFSKKEIAKLKFIIRGKKYGFSLEEIKEMILLFDLDRTGIRQLERTVEYGEQKIKEIEDQILQFEGIFEVAVIGVPHPEWGETVKAVFAGKKPIDVNELKAYLSERLASFKVPRIFEQVEALPRNASGKILKQQLKVEVISE